MKRYSLKEKLKVVKRLLSGERVSSIVRETGIEADIIRLWRLRYEKSGEKGLAYPPNGVHHSEEEKMLAVHNYYEKNLSLSQIAFKYNIGRSTAGRWVMKYRSQFQPLPRNDVDLKELLTIMTKEPNEDLSSELNFLKDKSISQEKKIEILKEKFLYERARNEYLKKVDALVQEEKAQRLKQGYESSKN